MASAASPQQSAIRFGVFELDAPGGELRKRGLKIHLRPQAARVLFMLARRAGRIVTREELRNEIWGAQTFVDFEHGLNLCIRQIRAALDDNADTPRYIETLPRQGYRFIAAVEEIAPRASTQTRVAPANGLRGERDQGQAVLRHWPVARVTGAAVLVILALLSASSWRRMRLLGRPHLHIESLAVLPLENLSRDPDQEYFADGMTDELITDLAQIHALRIISRNSVMQYKGKHTPMQKIARELNVDAVIEGTVVRSGDRVRITAQLIEASRDRHLWADTYEGDFRNILALQDEVARSIAEQVQVKLTPQEQTQLTTARPVDPAAHQAYLRGLHELRNGTPEGNANAIHLFQRALSVDPEDALAYEGLAAAYILSPDEAPKTVMPKARAAALKAIELDDSLAEAHSSLGFVKLVFDWDWAGAQQELRKALALNPNSPRAHSDYARYLLLVPHNAEEAIQNVQRAYALDPAVPEVDDTVALLFFARRYQTAIDQASKALENNSPFLALAYAELGQRERALAVAARAAAAARVPTQVAQTATAYALAGDTQRARALLRQIIAQENQRYLCGMNVGAVYSTLGQKDEAMAWLEKAYRDRSI